MVAAFLLTPWLWPGDHVVEFGWETVKTVSGKSLARFTGLKPGANETDLAN